MLLICFEIFVAYNYGFFAVSHFPVNVNVSVIIAFTVYNLEMSKLGNIESLGVDDNWRNYIGANTIRWMMKGTRGMKGPKGMDCILRREEIKLPW